MSNAVTGVRLPAERTAKRRSLWQRVLAARGLYLMMLPGLALLIVFNYGPMYGVLAAFQDYKILGGISASPWVGFKHFQEFLANPAALRALRNTLFISALKLAFGFPAPVILALLINEVRDGLFKRFAQTISYVPYFISWVVLASLITSLLSPSTGVVNAVLKAFGQRPIYFLTNQRWFIVTLVVSEIWKGIGWGSIIYLAALSGVEPSIYEAAMMDGASRVQRMRHISLPSIMPIVALMLILSMGGILSANFDQIFNLYNPQVYQVADILDTFVYRVGLVGMEYSFGAAVGLFRGIVSLVLVLTVNEIARRTSERYYALW